MLAAVALACATNTPVAQQFAARPTRTPLPTFTNTPIPPSATPIPTETDTVVPTNTPVPTETPIPTDTPVPATEVPTDTPVPPTNTPAPIPPTNTPVPPTNTPVPTPIPEPVSPVATPTPAETAVPASPPGKYKPRDIEEKANCAHIGVTGFVKNGGDDDAPRMPGVTIMVTGDEDGFRGPYYGTTDSDGDYAIVLGELGKIPERVEFKAEIFGPGVDTDDEPEWSVSDDCHGDDANQIMDIEWYKK